MEYKTTSSIWVVKYKDQLYYACGVKVIGITTEFVQLLHYDLDKILTIDQTDPPAIVLLLQLIACDECSYTSDTPTRQISKKEFIELVNKMYEKNNIPDKLIYDEFKLRSDYTGVCCEI